MTDKLSTKFPDSIASPLYYSAMTTTADNRNNCNLNNPIIDFCHQKNNTSKRWTFQHHQLNQLTPQQQAQLNQSVDVASSSAIDYPLNNFSHLYESSFFNPSNDDHSQHTKNLFWFQEKSANSFPRASLSRENKARILATIDTLRYNLRHLESKYDSDATDSSSGGESGDEFEEDDYRKSSTYPLTESSASSSQVHCTKRYCLPL